MAREIERDIQSKYRFSVGEIVVTTIELSTENDILVPAGTEIRIVAIAPKVYKLPVIDPREHDTKEYFYNAVLLNQKNDWENRIRAHFVTIRKIKKNKEVK